MSPKLNRKLCLSTGISPLLALSRGVSKSEQRVLFLIPRTTVPRATPWPYTCRFVSNARLPQVSPVVEASLQNLFQERKVAPEREAITISNIRSIQTKSDLQFPSLQRSP